jgi:beta-glucosidase-like glycosyl hydrolase
VTALEARSVGINTVLAPVVDVLSRPSNPIIGNRSFGGSAEIVSRLGAAWIAGAQDQGVLACAKHFPGHGHTAGDSHAELPTVDDPIEALERRELPSFRAAIAAGVASIMTAHVVYSALDPDLPATLSSKLLKDLLRTRLGFGGLVISDALTMEGLLVAGVRSHDGDRGRRPVRRGECDLLLHPTDPYAVAAALEQANAWRVSCRLRASCHVVRSRCRRPSTNPDETADSAPATIDRAASRALRCTRSPATTSR